jgi:hypothetical protein
MINTISVFGMRRCAKRIGNHSGNTSVGMKKMKNIGNVRFKMFSIEHSNASFDLQRSKKKKRAICGACESQQNEIHRNV